MAPLNVGLMGYGFSTKCFHLPFILPNPDLNVYAFLQRSAPPEDPSSAKPGTHCTVDYPKAKHYRTADAFFADDKIDLVIVCTKHDTHAEFAERSLKSGKHVVIEKPFTVSLEQANRVLSTAKQSDKVLTVFQNRRYDSDFRTLEDLVNKKVFGEITEAELHYDVDFPPWMSGWKSPDYQPGSGMLFGLGSHSFDQTLALFGKPKSVTGIHRSLRGVKSAVDDTFTVLLQYESNLVVTVKTTVVAAMVQPLKHFVRGYDGTWIKYGTDVQESQVFKGMKATDKGFGVEPPEMYGELTSKTKVFDDQQFHKDNGPEGRYVGKLPSFKGEYTAFYTDLVKTIRGEGPLVIKPEQSRDGIKIIELARQSAEEGRTLPFE